MASAQPVFLLQPSIQSYDWGKIGSESKVAQLAAASNLPGFRLDEKSPYAEVRITDMAYKLSGVKYCA